MKSVYYSSSGTAGVGIANNYALNVSVAPNLFGSGALLYTSSYPAKSYNGGKFSKMWIDIAYNTRATNTLIQFINNGVVGNQSITIPAGATGRFVDASNSDTVIAGDSYAIGVTFPVGGGTIGHVGIGGICEDTTSPYLSKFGNLGSMVFNNYTRYGGLSSISIAQTIDEVNTMQVKAGGTLKKLTARVYANNHSVDITINTRINGADGNMSIVIPANTTGFFEDITHTDTIVAGDTVNLKGFSTAAATGIITAVICTDYESSELGTIYGNTSSALTISASTTHYLRPNGSATSTITQAQAQMYVPGSFTIKNARLRTWLNNFTTPVTCTLQKNGVDTAITFDIPAGSGNGAWGDYTNTIDVVEGDLLNWKIVGGPSGTATIYSIGLDYTETSTPSSGGGDLLLLGVG